MGGCVDFGILLNAKLMAIPFCWGVEAHSDVVWGIGRIGKVHLGGLFRYSKVDSVPPDMGCLKLPLGIKYHLSLRQGACIRIAVFGGLFHSPIQGHVRAIARVRECGFAEVGGVPGKQGWFKAHELDWGMRFRLLEVAL